MSDTEGAGPGWFEGLDPDDQEAAAAAIQEGEAAEPADWPRLAVEAGFAESEGEYYERLQHAAIEATRSAVKARESADDRQLIHAVRALEDCTRTANELAERLAEWAGSLDSEAGTGVAYARDLADRSPDGPVATRLVGMAKRVVALADEAAALRGFIERTAPSVAPNLSALAGPVLAARLLSEAGSLEDLARLPSGTVQVLGAEDALFAHLQGGAPSPKHGVIYTHEYVRGTPPAERGSAARALAGKLTIAARVDHYSGDRRRGLDHELAERIERIQERDTA
jgi:nucleolar protein 56